MVNVYYLNYEFYFEGESERSAILDEEFFENLDQALTYGETYIREQAKDLVRYEEELESIQVNYEKGTAYLYTDDFSLSVTVCSVQMRSLPINEIRCNGLYYINYFRTYYYLDGDEILEPDEMSIIQVLNQTFFSDQQACFNYLVSKISETLHARIYITKQEGLIKVYGILNDELAYEVHYIIHNVKSKSLNNILIKRNKDKVNDKKSITKQELDYSNLDALIDRYNDMNVYNLLCEAYNDFELWR